MRWAVKESFIEYVRALEDGSIDAFDGAEWEDGAFVFPGEASGDGGVSFTGGVRFRGFAGMLDVRLAEPMIEGDGAGMRLTALVGPESIAARAPIATLDATEQPRAGESWTATPKLTFEGVRIFGDVYQVGAELAQLVVDPER